MSATQSSAGSSSDHRDRFIDAMRGTSALAVMVYHFNVGSYYPALMHWHRVVSYGYLGVAVFFVISGYCIGKSWLRSPDMFAFLKQRFRRIYPAYAASVAFIILCALVRKHFGGINDVARIPTAPASVLAVFAIYTAPASTVPTMNWVYWSLTYEVFFYLVLGMVLCVPTAFRPRRALLAAHGVLCALALSGWHFSGTPLFFVDNWNLFALGIGICMVSIHAREAYGFLAISAATLIAKAALGRLGLYDWVAMASVVLLLLPHRLLAPGPRHPLVYAGRISYSLYLLHVPVALYVFMRLVRPWIGDSPSRSALMQVAAAALVIACAAFSYRFVERPFLRPRLQPAPAPS